MTVTHFRWLSTNVEQPVYNELRDHLVGFNSSDCDVEWEDVVDLVTKDPQIYLYCGLLEDPKTGERHLCTSNYLDRGACEEATYGYQDPAKVEKVIIESHAIPTPTSRNLLMYTYHLMQPFMPW